MAKDWNGNNNSIFKALGASNHTANEREDNDYYATDPTAIDKLLAAEMKTKILDELLKEIRYRGAYEVSRKSGIPKSTIESWLYGKAVPSLTKAEKVADAMDLELLLFERRIIKLW